MAGCMVFVFAALGEFVVVKVLDVQYQYQVNRIPKVLPMVRAKQYITETPHSKQAKYYKHYMYLL